MKRIIFGLICLVPCIASASHYVSFGLGTDYGLRTDRSNSHQKVGFKVNGIYGWKFDNGFRVEGEVSYREGRKATHYSVNEEDKLLYKEFFSNHNWSYMANGIYDISQLETYGFIPFLGAGLGICQSTDHLKKQFEEHSNSVKEKDSRFAWQGFAGLKYPLAQSYETQVKYNYFVGRNHGKNHSVTVELVKNF